MTLSVIPTLKRDGTVIAVLRSVPVQARSLPCVARCGECSIDPNHPKARLCAAANCPLRHVATDHHDERNAA